MAKLYFNYSSMNAGKSTALLQANHNYHERGMKTKMFTYSGDNRFEKNKIVSTPAYMVGKSISEVAEGIEKTINKLVSMI